jgi:hypothetical protein
MYPVTAVTSLKKAEKRLLIDKGIVSCRQLMENRDTLRELSIPTNRLGTILAETKILCDS